MSIYENKIINALKYIQNHLSETIVWNDVSKECGISEYHFHRIFTTAMSETPGDYIKRKRLEKAAMLLVYKSKEHSITEISLSCGYSSQANFSKAFKIYFGVTPRDIIKGIDPKNSKIGKIKSKYGKDFSVQSLYPNLELSTVPTAYFKEILMKAEIKELAERKVIYAQSSNGYVKESIYSLWEIFIGQVMKLPNIKRDDFETYGIGHDNPQVTPLEKCKYEACILLPEGTKFGPEFKTKELPQGKYACFQYSGSDSKLVQLYLDIYTNWFPKSGYEPGDFPLIEKYLEVSPETDNIKLEVQFYLK